MEDKKNAWHPEAIAPETEKTILDLQEESVLADFYLAGGTGLALHFGHRRSVDLDFFSGKPFSEDVLLGKIQAMSDISHVEKEKQSLYATIRGTKVSFLAYEYPMLFPTQPFREVEVADHRDIACMKVTTIMSRGKKRVFIDLYVVANAYSLKDMLQLFERKYDRVNFNPEFVLKSLTYFDDAEEDPMPEMLAQISWDDIKAFFRKEAPALR